MKNPRSILITGGSSGIGEGLLKAYAAPGMTLAFNGRDRTRIEKVAEHLRSKGATVYSSNVDVTDKEGMAAWIANIDDIAPLDLVIANAGIATPEDPNLSIDDKTKRTFDVNVYGVFNTVHPALERMLRRGSGQIAIISSIAGFTGLPYSPSYSASKAAVKAYGKALRLRYRSRGVRICVVCPGVVHTRMTRDSYMSAPGWLTVDKAVSIIINGLRHNRGLIAFPWFAAAGMRWVSSWPESWQDRAFGIYGKRTTGDGQSKDEWLSS
jgi:short-subunit dehydrogenase